jgi:heme oxygenase
LGRNIVTAGGTGADVEGMEDMKSVIEWPEEATKETLLPAEIDGEGDWVKEGDGPRIRNFRLAISAMGAAFSVESRALDSSRCF